MNNEIYLIIKKTIVSFVFFLIATLLYAEDNKIPKYKDYSFINSIYHPRDEGSKNEQRLIEYIKEFCQSEGISYQINNVSYEKEYVTHSYNIEIDINKDYNERIVILSPLNSLIIDDENIDNSISVFIMLELIKKINLIKENMNKRVTFLFCGAIGYDEQRNLGIENFIENTERLEDSIVTIIDILSVKGRIRFSGSINKKTIPQKIVGLFLSLEKYNNLIYLDKREVLKSKFNFIDTKNYSTDFINKNISAVLFTNRDESKLNQFYFDSDMQNKLINFFYDWIMGLNNIRIPVEKNYNYVLLSFFNHNLIIEEITLILSFIIIIFLIIFIRLFIPNFQRIKFKHILKIFPRFFFLMFIFYLFSFTPYLLSIPIGVITKNSNIYLNILILYYFTVFFTSLLFIILVKDGKLRVVFPNQSYLFIVGAIIFSFINLIVISLIDISLSYMFIWAIIFITLSNFTGRNFILKIIFYLISAIPMVNFFSGLLYRGDFSLSGSLFNNIFFQNIIFSLISFPFLLLLIRVNIILKYVYHIYQKKATYVSFIIIIFSVYIVFLILASPIVKSEKQHIDCNIITDVNDELSHIYCESNKKIGEIFIKDLSEDILLDIDKNSFRYNISTLSKPYQLTLKKTNVGSITKHSLLIDSDKIIKYVKLYLILDKGYYPLDSNYNNIQTDSFTEMYNSDEEDVFEFITPRNINNHLSVNYNLLKNNPSKLYIELEYYEDKSFFIRSNKDNIYISKKIFFLEKK